MDHRFVVNGGLLGEKQGQNVSIMVKVVGIENGGTTIKAETTDGKQISVLLSDPINAPTTGWIEVIGTSNGPSSVRCREIITFKNSDQPDSFDAKSHNAAVMFWNNCKDPFQTQ